MNLSPLSQIKIAAVLSLAFVLLGCEAPSTTASEQAPPIYPGVVPPAQPDLVTITSPEPPSALTNLESQLEAPAQVEAPEQTEIKPVVLSDPLKEVVKLAQSGVGDDVIVAYIENSTVAFRPTPDEILYLTDLGLSDVVITALVNHLNTPAPPREPAAAASPPVESIAPAPESAAAVPAETTYNPEPQVVYSAPPVVQYVTPQPVVENNYFYSSLSPYGNWVDVADYGYCWQPSVAVMHRGWRPYCDRGRWLTTDCGWYWQSDYSWGWAPFHYGRWFNHPSRGWCWRPDSVWAPAWVSWRYTDAHCGWAPLPPGSHYRVGGGISYYGASVGINFGFGLHRDAWTFVPANRMHDREIWRHRVGPGEHVAAFRRSQVVNNYVVNNHTIINRGIGVDRVPAIGRSEPRRIAVRDVPERGGAAFRPDRLRQEGADLVVYRPKPSVTLPRTPGAQPDHARPIHSVGGSVGNPGSSLNGSTGQIPAGGPIARPRSEPAPPTWTGGRNNRPAQAGTTGVAVPGSDRSQPAAPSQVTVGRSEPARTGSTPANNSTAASASRPAIERPTPQTYRVPSARSNPAPSWQGNGGGATIPSPAVTSPQSPAPVRRQEVSNPGASINAEKYTYRAPAAVSPAPRVDTSSSISSTPSANPSFSRPVQSRATPTYSAPAVQSRPTPSYSPPAVQQYRPAPAYSAPAMPSRPAPSYSAPAVQSRPTPSYSPPAVQARPVQSAPAVSAPAVRSAPQSRPAPAQAERSNGRRQY